MAGHVTGDYYRDRERRRDSYSSRSSYDSGSRSRNHNRSVENTHKPSICV